MSAGGGGTEGDVDLNIAPIVDCFTVLIAYLLVSISFISLQILNVEVSAPPNPSIASEPEVSPPKAQPLTLSVQIVENYDIKMKLTGGEGHLDASYFLPAQGKEKLQLDQLQRQTEAIKKAFPSLTEVNVSADDRVQYKQIVEAVHSLKGQLGKVFLASS